MHVQRNNPIGPDMMYLHLKGPTPWGSDAHIEDQSFRDTMHVQWANPTHTCTCVHGRCRKNHLYGILSLHREEFILGMLLQATMPRIKLRKYRSSVHKRLSKMHTVKWNRMHVHVTMCGVRVCHHHQTGYRVPQVLYVSLVHKNLPYIYVQVYIRNNASVRTNA